MLRMWPSPEWVGAQGGLEQSRKREHTSRLMGSASATWRMQGVTGQKQLATALVQARGARPGSVEGGRERDKGPWDWLSCGEGQASQCLLPPRDSQLSCLLPKQPAPWPPSPCLPPTLPLWQLLFLGARRAAGGTEREAGGGPQALGCLRGCASPGRESHFISLSAAFPTIKSECLVLMA